MLAERRDVRHSRGCIKTATVPGYFVDGSTSRARPSGEPPDLPSARARSARIGVHPATRGAVCRNPDHRRKAELGAGAVDAIGYGDANRLTCRNRGASCRKSSRRRHHRRHRCTAGRHLMSIPWIDADRVEAATPWPELIDSIRDAFCNEGVSPARHSHRIPGEDREDITLLLMPSWTRAGDFGVKMISVAPSNASRRLPTINGVYVLFSADTGIPVALLDAETLTTRRTAAASALASERLARTDAKTLLVIGTGMVARQLIAAHCAVRPIEQVWVWGRSPDTAEQLAADVSRDSTVACAAVSRVESYAPRADIISTATFSEKPLLEGQWVNPGRTSTWSVPTSLRCAKPMSS